MRILVLGAGATGGYFGARLAAAGRDVTFLVRPARAAALQRDGLQIVSPRGDLTIAPHVVTADAIDGPYDVVLIGIKAFALEAALADVAPAIGSQTMIVPFLNGMRHIDVLDARFGAQHVLGGLAFISVTIDDAGRIVHLNPPHAVEFGERSGERSPRIEALEAALSGAGFDAKASTRIVSAMWEKWITLASLGGINALMRGSVGEVVAAPGGTAFATAFFDECTATAEACGYVRDAAVLERTLAMLTAPGSSFTSSMYRDLIAGNDVEADQILGDLLARARAKNVATPLLAAAYAHYAIYQARR